MYGVGVNDADYQVSSMSSGKQVLCRYYSTWRSMFYRCYSESHVSRCETYAGCSVHPDWHSFMAFRSWMEKQDWKGKVLDKDLLVEGNKVYSEDNCVFLDETINLFISDKRDVGVYPRGVYLHESGLFCARTGSKFTGKRTTSLGYFKSPEEAHEAYRVGKYKLALQLAEGQKDKRVVEALIRKYIVTSEPSV